MSEGFYVYIRNGSRTGLGLGPYHSEPQAREHVDLACELAHRVDPWSTFYRFGTCKVTTDGELPTGRLNHLVGTVPATPPSRVDSYRHHHPAGPDPGSGERSRSRPAVPPHRPVENPLYLVAIGATVYERFRDGRPFTLVEAMRLVYGTAGATICRLDPGGVLVPVVAGAGSASEVTHVRTGRRIMRRLWRSRYQNERPPPPTGTGDPLGYDGPPLARPVLYLPLSAPEGPVP